jgi:hypothetical protein
MAYIPESGHVTYSNRMPEYFNLIDVLSIYDSCCMKYSPVACDLCDYVGYDKLCYNLFTFSIYHSSWVRCLWWGRLRGNHRSRASFAL